jgi:hypothetical protein
VSACAEPHPPVERLTVSELLTGAGRALAVAGPGECWVTGTLSGWRTTDGDPGSAVLGSSRTRLEEKISILFPMPVRKAPVVVHEAHCDLSTTTPQRLRGVLVVGLVIAVGPAGVAVLTIGGSLS